ncbi:hypothetical protein EK21DRAFT_114124 [Setomelanomma holmii]|uniref:DUF6594 domain-containing protein n=1 Tax=Setomelanomma holmii TaxID=210430 RepID=A0A9P4H6P2_9PLEO|nr:hypothetical protein EK21DRAFT_114124 [Setomelanomma holmii]
MTGLVDVANAMEKGEVGRTEEEPGTPPSPPNAPSASATSSTLWSTQSSRAPPKSSILPLASRWYTSQSAKGTGNTRQRKKYHVPVKTRRINDHPKGYPNLAAFLDSDDGFAVYRRFGYLQARILLQKQAELTALEEALQATELEILNDDDNALCNRKVFGPHAAKQRKLLKDIESTYCSYAQILTAAQQMMSFKKPSNSEYQSVGRYLNNRQALVEKEATWIQHKEDIITLRTGRDHAWLDDIIEGLLRLCHCRLIDLLFRSKETRKKAEIDEPNMPARPPKDEDKYELYYTPSRINKLANSILPVLVLTLLVLPIYLLYHMVHDIRNDRAYSMCIGTLLVFTLAFSAILSLFTKAKRHEIFAAAAAYCAVLVVFLGNVAPPDASLSRVHDVGTPGRI